MRLPELGSPPDSRMPPYSVGRFVPITRHLARWYGWAASVPADPQRGLRAPSDRPRIGVFVKTPALPVIELLAFAGLDFVCLDAEHSAFGRRELDDALGMAGALRLPAFVRVAAAMAPAILQALDGGAAGLLVPHVDGRARAEEIARWSRPGSGGRGWSGSTRAAGYSTQPFAAALAAARHDPFVVAQIEDFDGLTDVEAIAAVPGIDALFFGAVDLAVGMGVAPEGRKSTRPSSAWHPLRGSRASHSWPSCPVPKAWLVSPAAAPR